MKIFNYTFTLIKNQTLTKMNCELKNKKNTERF